nr:DUF192 domain-containing protein [uncultured Cohaesibacter sp.]
MLSARYFKRSFPLLIQSLTVGLFTLALSLGGAFGPVLVHAEPAMSADKMSNLEELIIQSDDKDHVFSIEIAADDPARAKGLMYRTKIEPNHGMLFDFEQTEQIYMWMKNTYISLDMLFVDKAGVITHIVTNTTPLSETIISSGGPVRYVLEVKAGTARRLGLKRGDRLKHQLFTPLMAK